MSAEETNSVEKEEGSNEEDTDQQYSIDPQSIESPEKTDSDRENLDGTP